MREPKRISTVGLAAALLFTALTAASACAPDAVLGKLSGTGGASTSTSSGATSSGTGGAATSASAGTGGASTSSTSGTGGGCTGPVACATGQPGACSAGMRACTSGVPGPCVATSLPMPEDCVSTADLNCDGIIGCTGTVRWAQAFAPTGLLDGTTANDASGVAFSKADDVLAAGHLGGTTPIGQVSFLPTGFLASFAGATGAVRYLDTFGTQMSQSTGTAVATDAANNVVFLAGFYQGNAPPFGLTSTASAFFAAVNPGDGSVATSPADAGAAWSGAVSGTAVAVAVGPGDAPVILSGDCALTVGSTAPVALVTSGTATCNGLAFDASTQRYYVVGSFQNSITYEGAVSVNPLATTTQMFVVQLDATTPTAFLDWHQELGSAGGPSQALAVAVTKQGNVVVTGSFGGPISTGTVMLEDGSSSGDPELFVLELSADKGDGVLGFGFGGMGEHDGRAIAVDPSTGDFIVVGDFWGTLALGQGPSQSLTTTIQASNAFVIRIADAMPLTLRWALALGDDENQHGEAVAVDPLGDIAVSGQFDGTITYASTSPSLSAPSGTGAYVMRLAP